MTYLQLFQKANLNDAECKYYLDEAQIAIKTLGQYNPVEHFLDKETQFCVVEYALEKYKEIAISGLNKILACI